MEFLTFIKRNNVIKIKCSPKRLYGEFKYIPEKRITKKYLFGLFTDVEIEDAHYEVGYTHSASNLDYYRKNYIVEDYEDTIVESGKIFYKPKIEIYYQSGNQVLCDVFEYDTQEQYTNEKSRLITMFGQEFYWEYQNKDNR
jgi:hypothetical protein